MRPENWPELLNVHIEEARDAPFVWGKNDCVTFTTSWFQKMTTRDVFAPFRGGYKTDNEAMRVMIKNDVHGMEEAGRFLYGEPTRDITHMNRGDIVFAAGALGICTGVHGAFLNEEGVEFLRLSDFELGWAV